MTSHARRSLRRSAKPGVLSHDSFEADLMVKFDQGQRVAYITLLPTIVGDRRVFDQGFSMITFTVHLRVASDYASF